VDVSRQWATPPYVAFNSTLYFPPKSLFSLIFLPNDPKIGLVLQGVPVTALQTFLFFAWENFGNFFSFFASKHNFFAFCNPPIRFLPPDFGATTFVAACVPCQNGIRFRRALRFVSRLSSLFFSMVSLFVGLWLV